MREIPEDIYVAARKAYDEGFDKYGGNRLEAIAEAIWNERQRAAKIAMSMPLAELITTNAERLDHKLSFATGVMAQRDAIFKAILNQTEE